VWVDGGADIADLHILAQAVAGDLDDVRGALRLEQINIEAAS
jgi:hypothetical protein